MNNIRRHPSSPLSVSIADVARRANVSISTVSRVVNGSALVNPQTRQRVEAAIAELGYRPNAFARGLMLKKSDIIGLVLPDLHGEFYSEIIRGANRQARELGYNLLMFSARDGDDGQTLWRSIQQRTILDGVMVMVADISDHVRDALGGLRIPFVLLDDDIPGSRHDSVVIDQYRGAENLVHHLVENRRLQRIIFIGGLKTNVDTIERLRACRDVLAAAHRPLPESDVHYLDYEYQTAYRFALANVAQWSGHATAVFAANDEMAAGVVAAANERGVRVPDELAIVGFDDTRIARMTRPPLTTVRVPMAEMGSKAVELLCRRLADPTEPPVRISLEPELIVRESCAMRPAP